MIEPSPSPAALTPIALRAGLPATPLKIADKPPDDPLRRGVLIRFRVNISRRPVVGVKVHCAECGRCHVFPWRWDWGTEPDVVSYQVSYCRGVDRTAWWIGLDPVAAELNAKVHAESHEAFIIWTAGVAERKLALKAARKAAREAAARDVIEPRRHHPKASSEFQRIRVDSSAFQNDTT